MVTTILMINKIRSETVYSKFETSENIKASDNDKKKSGNWNNRFLQVLGTESNENEVNELLQKIIKQIKLYEQK